MVFPSIFASQKALTSEIYFSEWVRNVYFYMYEFKEKKWMKTTT